MAIPDTIHLPPKFQPFLVGSPTCSTKIDEINAIFQRPLTSLKKDYVFDAGKWVFKLGRTDKSLRTTSDTHLYRIRKAEKIRTYIHQNNLQDHIVVPRKYLYWNTSQNQFYLVAEKMSLSSEVAVPASLDIEATFTSEAASDPSCKQSQALANNAPKRSLTVTQARALAELSVLSGYTDLTYNNLYFTHDGKVAIIDTEPVKRALKKDLQSNLFFLLFGEKGLVLTQHSISGIAKLKLYIDNPTALQAVQKVEADHVLRRIAQFITKIFLITLAIYFIPTLTALIPIAAVATSLNVSLIAYAALKNLILIVNIVSIYLVWNLSCQGLQGVAGIVRMERNGLI